MNFQDYTKLFMDYCKNRKNLNSKTLKAYRIDLNQYAVMTHHDMSKAAICDYIADLHARYEPKTVRRKVAVIKAFMRYLFVDGYIEKNPFDSINISLRIPIILPRTIPLEVISHILKVAYRNISLSKNHYQRKINLRDVAVLEMLFATGARVSEICNLKIDGFDVTSHTVKIFGKGSKERVIQIENLDVLKTLNEYYFEFEQDIKKTGYIFINKLHMPLKEQSVREIVNKYVKLSGYDMKITPHMFRHSFATALLEEDVDIRYIQRILGHSSITTTQIYTQVSVSKQKEILSQKHPRNKMFISV